MYVFATDAAETISLLGLGLALLEKVNMLQCDATQYKPQVM